jgi:MSHA biogenesis protein MshK
MKHLHTIVLAVALCAGAAQAQDGIDPTRPPSVMTAPVIVPGQATVAPRAERRAPQLQSILVSLRQGGRRVAVIDGKIVRQGQRVGDAVLVSIGATEVVLQRGARSETLKLFRPAVRVATVQP